MNALEWVVAILCGWIGCVVAIVYMVQGKKKGGKMLLVAICANVIAFVIGFVWGAIHHGR